MRNIAGQRRHLDRKHAFGDQLTSAYANNANSQHTLGLRIDDAASSYLLDGPA